MQIINKAQQAVLGIFGKLPDSRQFYLTGGTALAHFYLQHRQSNDLDFFTAEEAVLLPFSQELEAWLNREGFHCRRQKGLHSFVELVASVDGETTLIHLALDAAFRFKPTEEFAEYPGLRVDNLTDIASNKLLALFGRATLRDFIDVHCLVEKGHFTKGQLIEAAQKKDPGFDLYWLGVAFERISAYDEDSAEMLMLVEKVPFSRLQGFFEQWRREISDGLDS